MKKTDTKGSKVTNSCGCSPKDTNLHKLAKMGYSPKFEKPSPKTPA